jgi:tRNA U55 pseudouridine synthase TruB
VLFGYEEFEISNEQHLMNTTNRKQRPAGNRLRITDGIILVDKESGPSSFRIVEKVKGLIKAKKAGHAGTLDPFATGVLIVLLNQGTKLSPFLSMILPVKS